MKTKIDELRNRAKESVFTYIKTGPKSALLDEKFIPLLLDIIEKQHKQNKNLLKLSNYLEDIILEHDVVISDANEEMMFRLTESHIKSRKETTETLEGVEL